MIATLKELLPSIEDWPPEDQQALVEAALAIEASRKGAYRATRDELAAIDEGLDDARNGRFALDEEVAALRAQFRAA